MDYTANHHLPQWEKSDRIMMDDFNAAMADIEAGLNQVQDSSDGGFENVELNMDRLRAVLSDIARDAYRRAVAQRITSGSAGSWDSMWINCLYSKEESGDEWIGGYGIHMNGSPATEAGIKANATGISYISLIPTYSYQSRTAAVQFTSDGYGVIESVALFTESAHNFPSEPFDFTITFSRADTGEVLARSGLLRSEEQEYQYSAYSRPVYFPLAAGVTYRMEYSVPESSGHKRVSGFVLANSRGNSSGNIPVVGISPRQSKPVVTKTVTPPDWAGAATVLVRWSGNGSVIPTVKDCTLREGTTRSSVNAQGKACLETEYYLDTLPEAALELTITMVQGAGALSLFDYGVLWR